MTFASARVKCSKALAFGERPDRMTVTVAVPPLPESELGGRIAACHRWGTIRGDVLVEAMVISGCKRLWRTRKARDVPDLGQR